MERSYTPEGIVKNIVSNSNPRSILQIVNGEIAQIVANPSVKNIERNRGLVDHLFVQPVTFRLPRIHRAPENYSLTSHIGLVLYAEFADWTKYKDDLMTLDGGLSGEPYANVTDTVLGVFGMNFGHLEDGRRALALAQIHCRRFGSYSSYYEAFGDIDIELLAVSLLEDNVMNLSQQGSQNVVPVAMYTREGDNNPLEHRLKMYSRRGYKFESTFVLDQENSLIPRELIWPQVSSCKVVHP